MILLRRAVTIDSREQTPWRFPRDVATVSSGLRTGDYSLVGLEHYVAIERKSLPDLVACCGFQRDRFERELARLSLLPIAAVIIESTLADVAARNFPGVQAPTAIVASCFAWQTDLRVPFVWASNPRCAAAACLHLLARAERRWEEQATLARLRGDPELAECAVKRAPRGKPRRARVSRT